MNLRNASSVFASRGLAEHILRGVIGLVALQQAVALSATQPLQSLVLAGTALLAFRGCPVCWTIGLVETTYRQFKRLTAPPTQPGSGSTKM